jgi:TfoX/Sxy family transcriptional regulator of competence genes
VPFEKPSQEVIDEVDALMPPPPVERRKMFGTTAYFTRGNMFGCVYGRSIVLRLPEAKREKLLRAGGEPFAPMGRAMREYVMTPPGYLGQPAKLRPWIKKAQAFAESLPPKAPKAARKRAAAPRPRTAKGR